MSKIIMLLFSAILFCGMIAEKERGNKKIYSHGFIVCIIAITIIEIIGRVY